MPEITLDGHDERLSDLFLGSMLLTTRLSQRASERHQQALWYCWGRQDAGDDRTRQLVVTNEIGGDFGFAAFAGLEAEAFERQYTCSLQCIQAQYDRFLHLAVQS